MHGRRLRDDRRRDEAPVVIQTGAEEQPVEPRHVVADDDVPAAGEMMRRVTDLLGQELPTLWGGTFHSIGNRILRRHADQIGFGRSSKPVIPYNFHDMARNTQIRSVMRAVFGINSPMSRPGVCEAIGFKSPRTSSGASGFGSQVSCCGGPPSRNSMMQAFGFLAIGASRAAIIFGSVSPKAPSPPMRIASRRDTPSHN